MSEYKGKSVVLAVDPGKKTGLSLYAQGSESLLTNELSFPETDEFVESVCQMHGEQLAVVCEKFTITAQTAKNTQAPWSLEEIGVCRYLAHKYGCEFASLQAPSSAKTFSTDARLKALGWWTPGKGHANDATRHLLLYLAGHGWWRDAVNVN
jgi:hypothetical protein